MSRTVTVLQEGEHRGFRKGYTSVPIGRESELRKELNAVIGGETRSKAWYLINGKTIIRKEMSVKIEDIFRKFGIEPKELWDE